MHARKVQNTFPVLEHWLCGGERENYDHQLLHVLVFQLPCVAAITRWETLPSVVYPIVVVTSCEMNNKNNNLS